MKYAELLNGVQGQQAIVRFLDAPAIFTPPTHKYGPDKPTRIVPVLTEPYPTFNQSTHIAVETTAINADSVVTGWSVQVKPVPTQVLNWQLEQELADRNLLAGLKTAISSLQAGATRNKAEARWNKKPTIDRTDPLVGALGAALGLTSNQVDEIFSAAANRT